MDHQGFLAGLPPETRAALTAPDTGTGLRHLALHAGVIALGALLIGMRVPGWPLLLPLHGFALIFLFTLVHECTHRTPFGPVWLNDLVGHLCGFLILLPFLWFRYFHLAHHRFTNIPGQDPELDGEKPQNRRQLLWHLSGLPVWWANMGVIWRLARGTEAARYLPPAALPRMRREARLMLALYGLLALTLPFSHLLFWIWILPILLGQPFLRLYLLAEHRDCPAVVNMFENTRTTFTTALLRFFAWNMPYHVEHHTMPMVPFHRLPQLHQLIRDHLRVTARGYVAFGRAYLARRR
ncbi:MAG: fatty acid desaturase [Paracoccaceae bacterium]